MTVFTPDFENVTLADTITEVKQIIAHNIVKVTFRKVNGETRVFERATNDMERVPAELVPTNKLFYDAEQVRLFVLDHNEWRSFKIANLISLEF
jgi:hypothetical protein